MNPVDYYKLCIYNVILTATTKKAIQKDIQNIIDKSKWNPKNCSSKPQEGRTKKINLK